MSNTNSVKKNQKQNVNQNQNPEWESRLEKILILIDVLILILIKHVTFLTFLVLSMLFGFLDTYHSRFTNHILIF